MLRLQWSLCFLVEVSVLISSRRIPFVASFVLQTTTTTTTTSTSNSLHHHHHHHHNYDHRHARHLSTTSPVTLSAWWNRNPTYNDSPATSTTTMESYKVLVKSRDRVSFDPDTGRYQVLERAAPSSSGAPPYGNLDNQNGAWSSFKQGIYNAVDVGKKLPSLPRRRRSRKGRRFGTPVLEDGYAALEQAILTTTPSTKESPGERFLRQYEQRSNTITEAASSRNTRSDLNSFEKFKEGLYITLDTASNLFSNNDVDESSTTAAAAVLQSVQQPVVVQSTLATSRQVRNALPDLASENPVKKWNAVRQIRQWEERELQQQLVRSRERQRKINQIKQAIYQAGDAAQSALDASVQLPVKIAEFTKDTVQAVQAFGIWLASLPQILDVWVQTVSSIPTKVEQTVTDLQVTVESSINTTVKVVEEIQTIPLKVQQSVDDTTKAVEEAVTSAKEVVTSAKVLVGLEKAQPKPPKIPPPRPAPTTPLGWKVAGMVASSTAQVAWWAGKGVAWMTWKGAELAWNKVSEQVGVAAMNQERPEDVMLTAAAANKARSLTGGTSNKKKVLADNDDDDDDLQREVQQALDLANEALRLVKDGKKDDEGGNTINKNVITTDVVEDVILQRKNGNTNNISKDELLF